MNESPEGEPRESSSTSPELYATALGLLPVLWRKAQDNGQDPRTLVLELKDSADKVLVSVPFIDLIKHDTVPS